MEFAYKAKSANGKIISGKVSSKSAKSARNDLTNRGLRPISVKSVSSENSPSSHSGKFIYIDQTGSIQIRLGSQTPTLKELAIFAKQFSLMIENGITLLQSLKLLSQQQKKVDFKSILDNVTMDVEKGANLSDAMEPHRSVFNELFVAMIRAGEESGHLDKILKQLVTYIEKSAKIKAQIKSAMAYPIIVVLVALGIVTLLLVWVVPSFAKQFTDSGQALPGITQFIIDASNVLITGWPQIVGTIFAVGFLSKHYFKTDNGRAQFDKYILKAPIFGDVMLKISISRFCSTMSTMLSSGVKILDALTICSASSGNKSVEKMVLTIRDEISKGKTISDPMVASGIFPLLVTSMVAVGEQTGTLDETLEKISNIYDDEVDTAIDTMTSMIEPLLIVVIGSIVGFIVIAMYLPIFSLAGTVGGD